MRVTVIGSLAFDTIETPYAKRVEVLGGSATFASISASFFTGVNLISVVGTDFPEKYFRLFHKHGIDTTGLERKEGNTFRWSGRYSEDFASRQTLSTHLNVFTGFKPSIPSNVRSKDTLLLANIDPDLQKWIFDKVKPSGLVACDTMDLWIECKRKELLKLLKRVDIFLLNDSEARKLSGETSLIKAAQFISSLGARMVVIKKGEHGALFFSGGKSLFVVPAYLLEDIVDPTGAGDTFVGGMMGYLSRKPKVTAGDLRRSLVYGSILASFTVEAFSVDGLLKTSRAKVDARYEHFRKLVTF